MKLKSWTLRHWFQFAKHLTDSDLEGARKQKIVFTALMSWTFFFFYVKQGFAFNRNFFPLLQTFYFDLFIPGRYVFYNFIIHLKWKSMVNIRLTFANFSAGVVLVR